MNAFDKIIGYSSVKKELSRDKCFWLPGIKLDIIVSFPGTKDHQKEVSYRNGISARLNSISGKYKWNLELHSRIFKKISRNG